MLTLTGKEYTSDPLMGPSRWHGKINDSLNKDGFRKLHGDPSCYSRGWGASQVIICLFVDDILLFSESLDLINEAKRALTTVYSLVDMG